MQEPRFTVRQIVRRIGPLKLCKMLGIGKWAPLKWYENGIPGRHWSKLVKNIDWLTYEILEDATALALRPTPKRRAA
jgi:hypothetical protein